MVLYIPLSLDTPIRSSVSDLISLRSDGNAILATFIVPHDKTKALRVHFHASYVMRMCDEHVLNLEDLPITRQGLIGEHFLYQVEGADFLLHQPAIRDSYRGAKHFRCVTGSTCLDVVADDPPTVMLVSRDSAN
ncbi:hypothetical protein NKJ74_17750 [Mesorhizobium sp. M0046]|uniref:hypothetical protein n=1 Tax=Mesorhizobium sp. M0046 TaxID=2956858 RepID=UPI00333B0BBA